MFYDISWCARTRVEYGLKMCHVWLTSLGSLFFSEGKQRSHRSGERGAEVLGGVEGEEAVVGMKNK